MALIGMSDQSFRIYITQYTQVNVLTRFAGVTYPLLERRNISIRLRYSDSLTSEMFARLYCFVIPQGKSC